MRPSLPAVADSGCPQAFLPWTHGRPQRERETREIRPFRIDIPQAQLDDLHNRLDRTRWPDELPGAGWEYGASLPYLRDLAAYWRGAYDWREREAELNSIPQFVTEIDGASACTSCTSARPSPDALPLMLTHGWPGSVVEFLDVVGPLTDPVARRRPADAFHLVHPAHPRLRLLRPDAATGWDVERVAARVGPS